MKRLKLIRKVVWGICMLSDECMNVSLSITKEGIIVFYELMKVVSVLLKENGKILKENIMDEVNNFSKLLKKPSEIKGAEVSIKELQSIFEKEKLAHIPIDKERACFNLDEQYVHDSLQRHMEKAGIVYAITEGKDRDGKDQYFINIAEKDLYAAQDVFCKWEADMAEYIAFSSLYGQEQAKNIDWNMVNVLTKEQKAAIKEKWSKCFESVVMNDLSEYDKVFEQAWKDSLFQEMDKEVFESKEFMDSGLSNREYFIKVIKESIPKKEIRQRFIDYKGKSIIYIDDENILHHVDCRAGKHYKRKCESLEEAKEAMERTNNKLDKFEMDLQGKYAPERGYNEMQRRYLYNCMMEEVENERVDISCFDKSEYPVEKMAALKECQLKMSKDNVIEVLKKAENLDAEILWELQSFNERDFPNLQIKSIINQINHLDVENLQSLYKELKESGYREMYDSPQYNERFEGVFQETKIVNEQSVIFVLDVTEKEKQVNNELSQLDNGIYDKLEQVKKIDLKIAKKEEELEQNKDNLVIAEDISKELDNLDKEKETEQEALKRLMDKKEECINFKQNFQEWKYIQDKKKKTSSLCEIVEKAIDKQKEQQDKVDNATEYMRGEKVEKNVMMDINIDRAENLLHKEIGPVEDILNGDIDLISKNETIMIGGTNYKEISHGEKFYYYLQPNKEVMVMMQGDNFKMDNKMLSKFEKAKVSFIKDEKEYKLMQKTEKGKVYVTKDGKSMVQLNKVLGKIEMEAAIEKLKVEKEIKNMKNAESVR